MPASLSRTMRLTALISGIILVFAGGYYFSRRDETRCIRCNVILISADSFRPDRMSSRGYFRPTTPRLDSFAAESWDFRNHFASAYLTPISAASTHTGLYPDRNAMIKFQSTISKEVKTLAELFTAAGYRSFAMGNSPEFSPKFPNLFESFSRGFGAYEIKESRLDNRGFFDVERMKQLAGDEPFFAWIALGDAHAPYGFQLKNEFADKNYTGVFSRIRFFSNFQYYYDGHVYNPFAPGKSIRMMDYLIKSRVHANFRADETYNWPPLSGPSDMEYLNAIYDNGIRSVDEQFGAIYDWLKASGRLENTVIIFESEHGEALGERKYVAHYDLYREQTNVPFIFKSPRLKKPERIEFLSSGVDVFTTLLDHLGLAMPDYPIDGLSFIEHKKSGSRPVERRSYVIQTRTPLWETVLKVDTPNSPFDHLRRLDAIAELKDYAIRDNESFLIHRRARFAEEQYNAWTFMTGKPIERQEFEFYDLRVDPKEMRPLPPDSPQAKKLVKILLEEEAALNRTKRRTSNLEAIQDYQ